MSAKMSKQQFEQWYRDNVRLMYYVAYEQLHNKEQAEDAVSEAVLRLYSGLAKWNRDDEKAFRKLALLVTKNAAIDLLRKNSKVVPMSPKDMVECGGVSEDVLEQAMAKLEMEQVRTLMKGLKEEERSVLLLRGVHGMSEKETAKLLGIKPKTVGVRLCRARKHLWEAIQRV